MNEIPENCLEANLRSNKFADEQAINDVKETLAQFEQEKRNMFKKKTALLQQLNERKHVLQELEIRRNKLQSIKTVYESFILTELCPRDSQAVSKLSGASFIVPIQKNKMIHAVKRFTKIPTSKVEKPLKNPFEDKLANLTEKKLALVNKISKNEDHIEELSNTIY